MAKLGIRTDLDLRQIIRPYSATPLIMISGFFMFLIIAFYIGKIFALAWELLECESILTIIILTLLIVIYVPLMLLSLAALLNINSHNPKTWRKSVRSSLLFIFTSWVSAYILGSSHMTSVFQTNPIYTTIVLLAFAAMMLYSKQIKEYYTVPGADVLPTGRWIKFLLGVKIHRGNYVMKTD
jgi:hypothetical protein